MPATNSTVQVSEASCGVRVIKGLDTSRVTRLLDDCMQPFEDSKLYSAGADAKFIDKSTRLSKFRAIVDCDVFKATADILSEISAADLMYDYSLVHSDVVGLGDSNRLFCKLPT